MIVSALFYKYSYNEFHSGLRKSTGQVVPMETQTKIVYLLIRQPGMRFMGESETYISKVSVQKLYISMNDL